MILHFRPVILTMAVLFGISSFSQSYRIFYDHHNHPAGIKVSVDGRTENIKLGGNLPDRLTFPGKNNSIDILLDGSDGTLMTGETTDDILEFIEPGMLPEGDLIRDAAYTPDGSRIAVIYQHSDNIFFYDSQTYEVLHITDIGTGPIDLDLSMDHAYVACLYSKEIYVIDLDDYTISDILALDRPPSQVEVSPDGSVIYVAFPSFLDGSVAAYSASTHELLFECPELFIHHYGYHGHNGRIYYQYYRFCLSDDGNYLTGTSDPGMVVIYDALTGDEALAYNDRFFCGFNASSTGDTLYLLTVTDDEMIILYRLRSDDLTKIDSISKPYVDVYFGQDDLAVSADGHRVLTQDSWNNTYLLFDFVTMSSSAYPANALFTQIIHMSYDRKYAICQSESGLKLFDMDSPGFISSYPLSTGYFGTASTNSHKFLAPDNHLSFENISNRNEEFYIIDFQDPDAILLDTSIIAGVLPEADMTTRACLSGDGRKIVSANFLSANVSLIDKNTQSLENIHDMDNIWVVTPIPGSEDVLLSGLSAAATYLYDTKSATIEKTISVSQAWSVTVSSDGQFAYAIDITGMLFQIALDNENTHVHGYVDVDFYENRLFIIDLTNPLECKPSTKPGLSPDGKWLLASAQDNSQGPLMHIVNTETMTIEKSLPVGNKATYDMAFTGDSRRACVASASDIAQIIYLDGANSYVENEVFSISGYSFLAAAFNEVTGKFLLGSKGMLNEVVPETGQVTASSHYQSEYILQIAADHDGIPMVRGQRKFFHGEASFALPGSSEPFAYDTANQVVVIPIPGPDRICLYDPLLLELKEIPQIGGIAITVSPNPASDDILIRSTEAITGIEVYASDGCLVYEESFDDSEIRISVREFASGVYIIKGKAQGRLLHGKFMVIH